MKNTASEEKIKIKKQPWNYGRRGEFLQTSPCTGTLGTLLLKRSS